MRAVPRLCEFNPGICLTTEEKARKNLSQDKENLSQDKENLSQVKKNLNQSTVYILPKHPHITKPTQTLQNPNKYTEQQRVIWQWTRMFIHRQKHNYRIIQGDSGGNVKFSAMTFGYCEKQKFIWTCVLILIGYGDTTVWIFNYKSIVNGVFVCFWRDNPQWDRASSFTGFLEHTTTHHSR